MRSPFPTNFSFVAAGERVQTVARSHATHHLIKFFWLDSGGTPTGSGTYRVSRLVRFVLAPCSLSGVIDDIAPISTIRAGLVELAIQYFDTAGNPISGQMAADSPSSVVIWLERRIRSLKELLPRWDSRTFGTVLRPCPGWLGTTPTSTSCPREIGFREGEKGELTSRAQGSQPLSGSLCRVQRCEAR